MFYGEGLVLGLKDVDPEVRVRAANALKELEDPRATMPLVEALSDSSEDVRSAAARALSAVGDHRAKPAIVRALGDESDSVRFWSAIGLQRIGDRGTVEALIQALSDSDEGVRMHAVFALADIADSKAIEPLMGALNDADSHVRSVALAALRESFGVEVSSDFSEALKLIREQRTFSEKMETILKVISNMEQASGPVRDEELYKVLESEHSIGEDEAINLLVKLLKRGLIHSPRSGYTQICV